MPTQALAAYGTELRLGSGTSPGGIALSAASNTTPIDILGTPHGIAVGDVTWVTVAGVTGNLGANGSWVAQAISTTVLRLRGSVGTGVYTGGGIATVVDTFTHVVELVNITPIGIQFNMVDASSHDGDGWGTAIPTHKSGVDMRLDLNFVPTHATHDDVTGLIAKALSKVSIPFLIVFPDPGKSVVAFNAFVSDHGVQTPVDGILKAMPVLSIDQAMIFAYA